MQTFTYFLAVFFGGGVGSLARWGISVWLAPYSQSFPAGSLVANLLSCFIVGIVASLVNHSLTVANHWPWSNETVRLLLITGFCGGFSTFSTLIRESFYLLENNRFTLLLIYSLGSFILGIVVLIAGAWIGNRIYN